MAKNNTSDHEFTIVLNFDHDDDTNDSNTISDSEGGDISDFNQRIFHGYWVVVPLAILMVLFIILAIVGNVMVIMTIVRHRGMRTRTNMFIVNLAIADILVAVLDMPVSLITIIDGGWIFGYTLCQLNGFTMALFLICSIHTLMYISIHKFFSITRPFSRAMTPKRIKIMIGAAWIWSSICAFTLVLGWSSIRYKKGASQCGPDIPRDTKAKLHSLFITTSNYVIPLAVMTFCYYRIFREIRVHMGRIRETSNINLASSVQQQKKVSITLFLVLLCFFVCWTPFVVYSTAASFMKDKSKMPSVINPLAYWCGYLNSACNPIIYAFRSPSFRKGYKEIICGQSASGLDAEHSFSFRSKSNRGSLKFNSGNVVAGASQRSAEKEATANQTSRPPRRLLSQTSWVSLPIIPFLIRSLSSGKSTEAHGSTLSCNNSDTDTCQTCFCLQCRRKTRPTDQRQSGKYWKNSEVETSPNPDNSMLEEECRPEILPLNDEDSPSLNNRRRSSVGDMSEMIMAELAEAALCLQDDDSATA